ncbi:MAG: hypothetical protein SGPRY_002846 [Prymnesium sp.]
MLGGLQNHVAKLDERLTCAIGDDVGKASSPTRSSSSRSKASGRLHLNRRTRDEAAEALHNELRGQMSELISAVKVLSAAVPRRASNAPRPDVAETPKGPVESPKNLQHRWLVAEVSPASDAGPPPGKLRVPSHRVAPVLTKAEEGQWPQPHPNNGGAEPPKARRAWVGPDVSQTQPTTPDSVARYQKSIKPNERAGEMPRSTSAVSKETSAVSQDADACAVMERAVELRLRRMHAQ